MFLNYSLKPLLLNFWENSLITNKRYYLCAYIQYVLIVFDCIYHLYHMYLCAYVYHIKKG